MSTPRDGADDGAGWHEPAHLGEGGQGPAPRPEQQPSGGWRPEGWDLPAAEPQRPAQQGPAQQGLARAGWDPVRGTTAAEPPVDPADPYGLRAWAQSWGWTASDGSAPQDAGLADLVASAPVRPGREHTAVNVVRGFGPGIELVAFDVAAPVGRDRMVTQWAVTAAPVLGAAPSFRLSPARFWKHRTGGLLQVPSGDDEFDRRWVLLAAEDGPAVRAVVGDPAVRQLLLASDDGDELWSAAGFVAAVRPDGQRPALVEHQGRILAAVVRALGSAG